MRKLPRSLKPLGGGAMAIARRHSCPPARGPRCGQSVLGQLARLFPAAVPGGEWSHGAMGNARWTGVRLKDVLDRAGVKAGAIQVRFNGMDEPVVADAP